MMVALLIFLYFISFEGISCQDLFYFSKHPENKAVVSGDSVELECQVSHLDNIIYYWNLNDTRLNNTTRRRQIGSNLYINRVDRNSDAGEYSCIAENVTSGFSLTSQTANLDVIWIGDDAGVQLLGTEDSVRSGNEVVLRCLTEGSGDIKYDWFRNEKLLQKTEKIIPRNKKLHIKDVSPNDNGVYRCRAHNGAGSVESKENFFLKIPDPSHPRIKTPPQDHLAKEGTDVRFDCSYENSDLVRWFFKDVALTENDTRIFIFGNGSLLLTNVDEDDEGIYVCEGVKKITDQLEGVQSYGAKLTISYLDEFTEKSFEPPPNDHFLITPEKRPFEVACIPPKGYPKPKVWWQNPSGRNVSYTGSVRIDGSLLIFESPRVASDGGDYTCFAENVAGITKFTFKLIISVEPLVPSEPEIRTVDEGDSFSFSCPYRGTPYPATVFKWKKDDKYLGHSRVTIERENGTILVGHAQPSDRGIYICEVNTTGYRPVHSRPYKLNVIEKLKFIPRPISKKLELGTNSKIPCKAQGTPTPVVRWLKDGMMEFPPHIHDVNGTLHFDNVSMSDKGRYVCVATSTQGIINATVDVDVIVAPKFSVKPQNTTEVMEGQQLMLHCMADGDPRPTITWDKNGEVNGFDSRFQVLENGTLAVQYVNVEDKGKYGCTAGNSGGLKREETLLIVKSVDSYRPNDGLESDGSMMTKTVTITLTAAAGYMFLVIGLMAWCRYRRRKRKQAYLSANPEGILLAKAENGDAIPNGEKHDGEPKNKRGNCTKSDGAETAHSHSSNQSKKSSKSNHYEKLIFSRQNLTDLQLIGHGIFGQVFVARAENISHPVLVKSLQQTRDESVLVEFKRETDMFHRLSHDNIARIIGLCRETEPHYLILEHTDWGELKHFLLNTKKERSKLLTSQIIDIAKQISIGMEHLSNARFVHKDLATRNCVISSDLRVKVSLIGLSKDVYSNDYMQFRNQCIPLRWLPYEAVFEDDYSTKSDVYSFAAMCWELFHQGERPFYNLPDSTVVEKLQRRELVIKPSKSAPPKMAAMLATCAASSPKDRPTFSNIAIVLGETLQNL